MSTKKLLVYTRKDGRQIETLRGGAKRQEKSGVQPLTGPEYRLTQAVDVAYQAWCIRRGLQP